MILIISHKSQILAVRLVKRNLVLKCREREKKIRFWCQIKLSSNFVSSVEPLVNHSTIVHQLIHHAIEPLRLQ